MFKEPVLVTVKQTVISKNMSQKDQNKIKIV